MEYDVYDEESEIGQMNIAARDEDDNIGGDEAEFICMKLWRVPIRS